MKIRSLVLLSCVLGCFYLSGCQSIPSQHQAVGPTYFPEGDSIILEDVRSSLGTFEKGDVVTIKGKYKLTEKPETKLLLTITQTETNESQSVEPEQTTILKGDDGNFELSIKIRHQGYLHLSLRTASGEDKVFGALYFGTENQMNEIADWDIASWYQK